MNESAKIIEIALETLDIESDAIKNLKPFINKDFVDCVNLILKSKGRVVWTGVGKSAIIAQKIVATLNSTGTPAIFMHAADAIHGDLGIIQKDDIVICISKSGNTPEIKALLPMLKRWNNTIIAMVGNVDSYLAKNANYILNTSVEKEACPNNLAPTSSSTAQLAMGDALAVCLLKTKGFTSEDFAKYHPGGALGKRLYLKTGDLCTNNPKPAVAPDDSLKAVIVEISSKRLGATAVIEHDTLVGIITDGDLRRMLEKNSSTIDTLKACDIMSKNPKTVDANLLAADAMELMQANNISQLIVMDNKKYVGIIHVHDMIREGIV